MEMLSKVNRRVKTSPEVTLPFEAIYEQFTSKAPAIVKNFALVYLDMAFQRLSTEVLSLYPHEPN